ncbi:MAG TPA: tRNA (N6-threonylcarbamoyladenosine(37)-N6)-methyltransferase TrmO [Acidobacteriota bacterium]|nr:tRNA (N6-threonylcarbamoyladenosine(37)-N6)-methyltransferase TrmO [Acidobacteriota bacterium]
MSNTSLRIKPIGIVHSPYKERLGTPIQGTFAPEGKGTIEIFEEFAEGLADIGGFSHIWVLYQFHLSEGYNLKVVPFMDDVERGLFSTRASRRPNPIGLSLLRLLQVVGPALHVAELDIVDGTPVLDIKPYLPDIDSRTNARSGWLDRIEDETRRRRSRADGRFCGRMEKRGTQPE